MKPIKIISLIVIFLTAAIPVRAQKFMNTGGAPSLFNLDVRVGMNAANRTFGSQYFNQWNVNSWGAGIEGGVVVDLNLRDFIALQPGFFFESRSGNYAYAQDYFTIMGNASNLTQLGHYRTYSVSVPLMVSMRFNLAPSVRWVVEAGPYAQYFFKMTDSHKIQVIRPQAGPQDGPVVDDPSPRKYDVGLKLGTGLEVKRRLGFYIHYMGGGLKAWENPAEGGQNKAWTFTVGVRL